MIFNIGERGSYMYVLYVWEAIMESRLAIRIYDS